MASAGPAAQVQQLVLPPGTDTSEGNGVEAWVAAPFTARRQLILDASWLQSAIGHDLRALSIRRNQGSTLPQVGGTLIVEIAVAHSSVAPQYARPDFAANRAEAARVVFQGPLAFPVAPAAPSTPAPWQAPYSVTIPFTVPFAYNGGPLVIETQTRPLPGSPFTHPWWPIDAVIGPATGDVQTVGQGCLQGGAAAGAERGTFTLGSTGSLWLRGLDQPTFAACCLGASDQSYLGVPLPLDLTAFGMPGCRLYNDIQITTFAMSTPWQGGRGGLAAVALPIPFDQGLMSAPLFAQWLVPLAGTLPGMRLSNGVRVTIGPQPPQPGSAWIEAVGVAPTTVRVLHDRCPVLRLEHSP